MENKVLGTIKTVLVIVLFLCAILMSFLSFEALQKKYSEPDTSALSYAYGEGIADELLAPDSLILPETVAVGKKGAHMKAITSGAEYMNDVYRLAAKDIYFALGSCRMERTDDDTALWNAALSSDEFIYVRYHSELSSLVIALDAEDAENRDKFDESSISPENITRIYEFLLLPSSHRQGEVFAFSRSADGECIIYTAETEGNPDFLAFPSDFDIYSDAAALSNADFYGFRSDNQLLYPTTVIYLTGLNTRKITVKEEYEDIASNTSLLGDIALLLDINPSKTGSYFDSSAEKTVYMPTHGELSVSESGILYSTDRNENGGVELSEYAGIDTRKEALSLYDCIITSSLLMKKIKALDKSMLGGEAEPELSAIYSENGLVVFEYKYFFNNIEIAGVPFACRMALSQDKLMHLEINFLNVESSIKERLRCLPQTLLISAIEKGGLTSSTPSSMLVFRLRPDEKAQFYTAEWEAIKTNRKG